MACRVGFIGLGRMGYPMAGHIACSGLFESIVYNRTKAKAHAWCQRYGGTDAKTPKECAQRSDILLLCLGGDDDVLSVMQSHDGVLYGLNKGTLIIDHTTTSATMARQLARQGQEQGWSFLDAPVSGGERGAIEGALVIMVGGDETSYARGQEVMALYGKEVVHMGDSGSGQLAKMVNQICVGGVLQGLSEAMAFAFHANLPVARLFPLLAEGAAGSWQMKNRYETMAEEQFDFGFKVDWMVKDLGFCLQEAQRYGCSLPSTTRLRTHYQALQDKGYGQSDTSSLIQLFRPGRAKKAHDAR
ncbi:MAG: NAD(P)-dependent oxidoreductase [Alphaproteobacteria bacterium GM7ARS4]|nr:NAD(P)-dependent oxidoreductase [Alphaproteobacteria bacterium GM7ARS4]